MRKPCSNRLDGAYATEPSKVHQGPYCCSTALEFLAISSARPLTLTPAGSYTPNPTVQRQIAR